jgi:hypothetical protein
MFIVIVEIVVTPLQGPITPGSGPVKDIELPLTVSWWVAPQWLEEAVHEPPAWHTSLSGKGSWGHSPGTPGVHALTCRAMVKLTSKTGTPTGAADAALLPAGLGPPAGAPAAAVLTPGLGAPDGGDGL